MTKRKLNSAVKRTQRAIYTIASAPIHAIFGNPGNQKAPNISNYGGGRFGGAGYSGRWENPTYSYNEIYPADTLLVPSTQTFNDAFADARRRGLDTFEFNGGIYGTELGDNPNWKAAGDSRTRDAVIPVPIPADTIRRTSDVPRNDTIITDVGYRRYPVNASNTRRILRRSLEDAGRPERVNGGIHIDPSKRGTFTAAATKHGMSVQGFASKVLANKEDYSPAMVKKANFARNASKWK